MVGVITSRRNRGRKCEICGSELCMPECQPMPTKAGERVIDLCVSCLLDDRRFERELRSEHR